AFWTSHPQGGESRQGNRLFFIAPPISANGAGLRVALPVNSLLVTALPGIRIGWTVCCTA
ncbi:MAG: hypothetical protein NTW71_05660, partial [Deltaproteobacteria bacterium]|nr:hypothetical protein [Deltaproteobacteria bacterium]